MIKKTADPLSILAKIWGNDRDGYVFLPYIDGRARTSDERRHSYHEGKAFNWPHDREAIQAHLDAHVNDDLYFTPALFNAKRRIEQNVEAERTLWADLDPVDPRQLGEYRPTIAWETSPGRYQGVWLLNEPLIGASWPSRENHRLSLFLGADPSGWDSTQLLRVPGRRNHKYDNPPQGRVLWSTGPRYTWDDFSSLPEISAGGVIEELDLADETLLKTINRQELWGRVRLLVTPRCRELYLSRSAGGDRSDALWEMEREFADAGCSVAEIIVLVRGTVWNKYKGRNDELKRLKIEAAKAIAERPEDWEEPIDTPKPGRNYLASLATTPIPRPNWLIDGIWTSGACGFIAGPPKSYKSWVAIDMAVAVATGQPFLGQYKVKKPGPVLYLQEEDSLRLVWDRLGNVVENRAPETFWGGTLDVTPATTSKALRGGPRAVPGRGVTWSPNTQPIPMIDLQVQTGFIASDPSWQAWLEESVSQENYRLIVIDTLSTTAGEVDTDKAIELMTKILRPMRQIAIKHKVAICIIHHNRKQSAGGRAGNDMLGSVALHAWVDCALYARAREDASNIIQLDRESKEDQAMSIRFAVPHMFRDYKTGNQQLWDPELLPDHEVTDEPHRPAKREGGTAGKSMAWKLKQCGGSLTRTEFLERVGDTKAKQAQVDAAISNGFIVVREGKLEVA